MNAIKERLHQIIDEIVDVFNEQERRIANLQGEIEENKYKEQDFLMGSSSLITRRLGD